MAYVIAASILSVVVSLVYLGYTWAAFRLVKNGKEAERPDASSEWEAESWFSWKALVSIVLSSVILFLLGKSAEFWNFVPFIAIGTAIAVIFAFALDTGKKGGRQP